MVRAARLAQPRRTVAPLPSPLFHAESIRFDRKGPSPVRASLITRARRVGMFPGAYDTARETDTDPDLFVAPLASVSFALRPSRDQSQFDRQE